MGAVGATRPNRFRGVPTPLLAVLLASLAAMLVLSTTQLAHGGSGGAGSRRSPPRLLLQGVPGEVQQRGEPAANLHVGSDDEGDEVLEQQLSEAQQWDNSPSDGTYGFAPSSSSHGVDSDSLAVSPADVAEQLTLEAGANLASFAGPGTHCVVTPSHSKVALLFLTHGDLPHDLTWTAWMREARGLLPRGSLAGPDAFCLKQCDASGTCVQQCGRDAACNPLCVDALRRRLGPERSPAVLQQQHLFSVYVHARPTLKDYKTPSIFEGRLIPDRAIAKPGTHAVAAAAKRLLEAAALDPRNAWFVLVGDTTVPLYHPTLFYRQLMSETQSRVDACMHKDRFLARQRSSPAMRTPLFDPARHWRKSSEWFVLNRRHADLVAHDTELMPVFGKHCFNGQDETGRMRECVSAEHYVPSLLAMYGMDNETTCDATGGTFQHWVPGMGADGTPQKPGQWMMYQPGHVTPELITSMREAPGGPPDAPPSDESELCGGWETAGAAAQEGFVDAGAVSEASCPATLGSLEWLQEDAFTEAALDPRCVLLAREFSSHAAKWVHRVYRSCTAALGVLECSQRLTDRDNAWYA